MPILEDFEDKVVIMETPTAFLLNRVAVYWIS